MPTPHQPQSIDEEHPLLTQHSPPTTITASQKPTALFGYSLMSLAAFAQATRSLLFHISETEFHYPPSTALILSATIFTILSFAYVIFGNLLKHAPLTHKTYATLFVRGLCTAATLYLNNIALARIPVGTALTIFSTTPAITSVFAAIFLRDALSPIDVAVLLVNLAGIVLVSQPSGSGTHPEAFLGVLAAIGAATSASAGFMLLKKLGIRVHFMLNMLSIGIGCIVIALCVTSAQEFTLLWRNAPATLITLTGATLGFVNQGFVNRAMQICRPGPASVVRTFNVPISFLFGLFFLNERISRLALLGVVLVLSSVCYIGLSQFFWQRGNSHDEQPKSKETPKFV